MTQITFNLSNYEFPLSDANRLLEPGYLPIESGYQQLNDGSKYIAALTMMPGCKGKMVDWWFGWCGDTKRYQRWHPNDHVIGEWDEHWSPGNYIGASHLVHEYLGDYNDHELCKLSITFCEPSEFFNTSVFDERGITAVCARIGPLEHRDIKFGVVIHFVRDTDFGCEMRSQFWLNENASSDLAKSLHQHCVTEMSNLAGFLPDLYRQETT